MSYYKPLVPFIIGLALILHSSSFSNLTVINLAAQTVLFTLVVCIPIWRTGRMSYVDIGWPWGLVVLGLVSFVFSQGYWLRSLIVTVVLVLVGLRMGLGALKMWQLGLLKKEFPRYQYQRVRLQEEGKTRESLALQVEAISQGLANASFLALPVFVIASNNATTFSVIELSGLLIWVMAFVMETVADLQKARFLKAMKKAGKQRQVCNVGLWRFCRHPNYFSEWMVWNGLIVASAPSWWALRVVEPTWLWLLLGAALLYTSYVMYNTLVYLTGAVPSEYYSVKKRPGYRDYQQQTNRFFPGPVRGVAESN
jgi:steroid 5-alpha reductase family enzyme